ncbi:MAG: F0F1 ATP synthase subunit A [Alphaproteobacteria bacterium]|nr:F0F1 ATP synthase subunit A [Alphaproteobacteria bacterium]
MSGHHSPLAQFVVEPLVSIPVNGVGGLGLSFTNASLFMVLAISCVIALLFLTTTKKAIVPGRWQSVSEMMYQFVAGVVKDNVGDQGKKYFPFVFTLFTFVLFCNLLGLMPYYSFTVTSHIIVTFALAMLVFLAVTIIGFARHGLHFFSLFLPAGTPWWMAPLMFFIELFAYLARPVSLSVRLAANMLAGHTMLKVIAGFVLSLGLIGGWLPFAFLMVLSGFEIFVAVLQAYIFTVLTCVYLNDAIHLH